MDPEDSGVKTMEQQKNSAAGQEMDAMDQDAERNSVSGSGAESKEAYTKMEPTGEPAKKGTMFDRWAAKSAGQGAAPEKKPENLHVPLFRRIGERSIHRHSRSRDRMQSPRGNKRDSRPRTAPRFRNRKETGDRRKKSRSRSAGKPSGALFRKRETLPEDRRGKDV